MAALILLILVPTLGVVMMALLDAGRSYRDASARHLQETAHVVAQSVDGELEAMSRFLAWHGAAQRPASVLPFGGELRSNRIRLGSPAPEGRVEGARDLPGDMAVAAAAAASRRVEVSNVFMTEADGVSTPRVAIAIPGAMHGPDVDTITLVIRPDALVRTLLRQDTSAGGMILAVTDGAGRIVARSQDADAFIGKPVPDWARLQAVGQARGSFEARTIEGAEVIFAFQRIDNTPGWVAVVGEPLAAFNDRWQRPVMVMLAMSSLTILAVLFLAVFLARRILRPIHGLVLHARSIAAGEGEPVAARVRASSIAEFEILRQSLDIADDTLRRRAQAEQTIAQALTASERRYRTIALAGALAFWTRDASGAMTSASGLESLGEGWQTDMHPDDLPDVDRAWETALSMQSPIDIEFRIRSAQGGWQWLRSRGAPIRSDDGELVEWIGVVEDITARKIGEDDIKLERERLALATIACRLGVWDYNLDADTLYCDARWYEILGLDPSDRIRTIEDFKPHIHPDDVERATSVDMPTVREMIASRRDYSNTFRIIRPDGEIRWLKSVACLIEAGLVSPNRAVGVVMDVTESRHAEEKLQSSYEALRRAERLARIGSWNLDLASGTFTCSDMLYEINGADPAGPPLTVADLETLLAPESYRKMRLAIAKCVETGEAYGMEVEHLRADGSSFAAHVRGEALRDDRGRVVGLTGTVQDISERQEERARLAALADNLPSGAIYRLERMTDGRSVLTYISAGIVRLIGVPAAEIVEDRTAFLRAIHPDDLADYQAAVERSLSTGEVFDHSFRAVARDGRPVWMHCRSAPRRQPDGRIVWDGIMRDITGERVAAEALHQAKEAAESAERAKSDFLATMSHEIRTPMNTVIGMTRLTLNTDLTPKQRNYLEKIDLSAKTLLGVIDDILDFSKIEAGSMMIEDTVFELDSLLESVSAVTAMRAEEKGLEIAFSVAADVPLRLRGDSLRLGQVFINLVSNALKFTEHGEVVISVGPAPDLDGAGWLQASVRDTGIGLDAEQVAGLFRPFSQAEPHTTRKYGGTGLGLAICKRLVEIMGGRIWVESSPGAGSTFAFTFPAGDVPEPPAPVTAGDRSSGLKGRRALIVDDNASARNIFLAMMRTFGMTAEAVESGPRALELLLSVAAGDRPFDLVLMDWRMPVMDGLETAQRIRAETRLPFTPAVLMVTAYAREEVLRGVERFGLQGLLVKPVTESVMYGTIRDILASASGSPPPAVMARDSAMHRGPSLEKTVSASLAGKRILVVDDNALNREVATDFLLAADVIVDTAHDGLDALDKLARQDYDAVLMDVHMPRMNGLAAAREIRRQPRWSDLPIVALTAQARDVDLAASLDAGMAAHLSKPIDETALYRVLEEVLATAGTPSAASGETPAIDTVQVPWEAPGFDLAATHRRLSNNPERVTRFLKGCLQQYAGAIQRMNGHLAAADFEKIADLAHMLRGTASYFEAFSFCTTAQRLEDAARDGELDALTACAPLFMAQLEALLNEIRAVVEKPSEPPAGPTDE